MSWKNTRWMQPFLCGLMTALVLLLYLFSEWTASENFYSPLFKIEHISEDMRTRYGRMATTDPRLVFVGVDKPSYSEEVWPDEIEASEALQIIAQQQFPWSRKIYGLLAQRLIENGARLVIFDFLFPHEAEGDDVFREAISAHGDRIILGANLEKRQVYNDGGTGSDQKIIWPNESLVGDLESSGEQVGLVNFWVDGDGTVRRLTFNYPIPKTKESLPTLVTVAARKLGLEDPRFSRPLNKRFRFTGPPQSTFKFRPVYELFVPSLWTANYGNGAFFKDKIVVVGPAANWTQDIHRTPFDRQMFGPELHLNALNAVLQHELIRETGFISNVLLILGGGIAAWLMVTVFSSPLRRTIAFLLALILYAAFAWMAYNQLSLMALMATPMLSFAGSGVACMVYQFIRESLEKARTRATLEKYVSQNVVKEMLDSPDFELSLGGQRRPCTILFSDIRGFTSLTENADSHQLVTQLNEYLTEMVECVFRNHGTLDKFIGDAVMAVWGNAASQGPKQDAIDAVQASLEMLEALDQLNEKWRKENTPQLAIGIGLNHGEVIVGNMGSPKRQEFTVIGDAVNLASRLEGTTKQYGLPMVIGEEVAARVDDHFTLQQVDLIQVKGKTRPVQSYTVLESTFDPLRPDEKVGLETYHRGIEAYLKGHFGEAIEHFRESARNFKRNGLAQLYIDRCEKLQPLPPDPDWNGVFVLKSK